ncbi:TPA: fimbrial protein [Serratia marcescens]
MKNNRSTTKHSLTPRARRAAGASLGQGLSYVTGALLLWGAEVCVSAQAANPPSITATYTVTTQSATCAMARADGGSGTVMLGNIKQGVLNNAALNPAKAQGRTVSMRLTCQGDPGAKTPKISVYGDSVDTTDGRLYGNSTNAASGGATNVGFLLTNNATGDTSNAAQILNAGSSATPTKVTINMNGNTNPDGMTIPFFVQVSRGTHVYSTVTPGLMTTTLHFEFLYE